MTEPRTYASPAGRTDRRTEFVAFYEATYPAVTGEVLALTGDLDVGADRREGVVRPRRGRRGPRCGILDWPGYVGPGGRRAPNRRPPRATGFSSTAPALPEIELDPEDEAVVAGLQRLPADHRLPLVLHYLGQSRSRRSPMVRRPERGARFGWTAGFDALVEVLDSPDDGTRTSAGTRRRLRWAAEALGDCARRFRETFPVPPPTLVFRRATVKKVTRRGAPVTAAAAAAAVGLVVYLSPTPQSTAQAAGYAVPPSPAAAGAATPSRPRHRDRGRPHPSSTAAAQTTAPAGTTTKSAVRRADHQEDGVARAMQLRPYRRSR